MKQGAFPCPDPRLLVEGWKPVSNGWAPQEQGGLGFSVGEGIWMKTDWRVAREPQWARSRSERSVCWGVEVGGGRWEVRCWIAWAFSHLNADLSFSSGFARCALRHFLPSSLQRGLSVLSSPGLVFLRRFRSPLFWTLVPVCKLENLLACKMLLADSLTWLSLWWVSFVCRDAPLTWEWLPASHPLCSPSWLLAALYFIPPKLPVAIFFFMLN